MVGGNKYVLGRDSLYDNRLGVWHDEMREDVPPSRHFNRIDDAFSWIASKETGGRGGSYQDWQKLYHKLKEEK